MSDHDTLPPTHPAAELFPLLEGDEFDALVEDIRANGLIEPVWMYDDPELGTVLLDGRNRWRASHVAGVTVTTRDYTGDDPLTFAISTNAKRRHLNAGQLAFVYLAAEPLYAAQAAARKGGRPSKDEPPKPVADRPPVSSKSRDKAAPKGSGTSGRSVGRAKRIRKQAPDLEEKVKSGKLAIDRAERIIRDREAEARKVDEAKAEAAAQVAPVTLDIRNGDFRTILDNVPDGSVDAIITDPPYPREFLPLLGDLAAWADKVLTPDGVLAVLIGQTHLPEVYRLLDGHRPYRWTCAYMTAGPGYVSHQRKIQSNWKPLIIYGGHPRSISDVIHSKGADANAKSMHKWGQDYTAFHTLIERLTTVGQTVADPFMGSGTTLLAAHALGRNVIGCDIDPEAVDTARERVA